MPIPNIMTDHGTVVNTLHAELKALGLTLKDIHDPASIEARCSTRTFFKCDPDALAAASLLLGSAT
jgi:hypothetical protein